MEPDEAALPGFGYGEVFTRRWVVDLILDLVGYRAEKDLGSEVLFEPSCGTGAFLLPAVERLVSSARSHDRDLRLLGPAIRAFDLLESNAELARKSISELLGQHGLTEEAASALASEWVTAGDFLLQPHTPGSVDYVVGNPPYIRLEHVAGPVMSAYRSACPTMRGRADIYIGFIERGLDLLRPGGALSFICADRWMRNSYGADLRELVTEQYAVEAVVSMHDADAFEQAVSAYPAIIVLRREAQRDVAVVSTDQSFGDREARRLSSWFRSTTGAADDPGFEARRAPSWFRGRELWPTGSPSHLAVLADLELRFAPLEDKSTGTKVGIGVATGCDDVFITDDPEIVEADRLLPLVKASDTRSGSVEWSGHYLVNPWTDSGLVDLHAYPRLSRYFADNNFRLRARHIARRRPVAWYRTIDRVDPGLTSRRKLVIPDMKATAHPVLVSERYYPHHNLYFVVSDRWDPAVLGGLLLSDIANLFVGAYCVRMRGGTYRFQAQYLRRIRVPCIEAIGEDTAAGLASAFHRRDRVEATRLACQLYDISPSDLAWQ
jgi:adenine-specific DNA-methyltransferase